MNDSQMTKIEQIRRLNRVIEKRTGGAVRPQRFDGYVNLLNRYGTSKDSSEHYQFSKEPMVPDDTLISFYEGNGLFAKIIDTPAEEAVKHGFVLNDIKDQKVIDFYEEALDELDWEETAMTALKWMRLFGGSLVVMLVNDGKGIDEPLDWSAIESIDDLRIYDRSLITPDYTGMFSYTPKDPFRTRGSRLGMPEYYTINSKYGTFRVHESRCLIFTNGTLPENTTNSEYEMWGMPEYVRINRAILDTELSHRCAPKMLDRSIQAIYKMQGLSQELATEEGETAVLRRLQTIDMARGMLNSITIDSEGEDYDFKQFQFSGVSEIIDKSCAYLSALTSIPQAILFGAGANGMSSTDDTSMENWYSYVERIQKRTLRGNLRYLLSVVFAAGVATGEIDDVPKIKPEFNSLWSLSENEQADLELKRAQLQQTKAATAQTYISLEVLDATEVRKKLASTEEFDIDTILDTEDIGEDDLFEDIVESSMGDIEDGNSPDAAPAATKLPQDMTDEERVQKEIAGDSEDVPEGKIGSVGVIVVSEGKVLCGQRHNTSGYGLLCGPGGHIDNGETPKEAAFRETEEEFGITPTELIPLGLGPVENDTGLQPMLYLCTSFSGRPKSVDLEIVNPAFRTLEEIENYGELLFEPFKSGLDVMQHKLLNLDEGIEWTFSDELGAYVPKAESTFSFISENPIDKSVKMSKIKLKDISGVNTDFGVKGMKWGEHKEKGGTPVSPKQAKVNLLDALDKGSLKTTIKTKKHNKHIKGSAEYKKALEKGENQYISTLSITEKEAQKLIDTYSGTGTVRERNGQFKETFTHSSTIGTYIDKFGNEMETNRGTIHYSKDGSHIVPAKPHKEATK